MSESCFDCLSGKNILNKKDYKIKNLAQQLRGTISGSRAKEMIEFIEKERTEWEVRSMVQIGVHQIATTVDQFFTDFWKIYTESFPLNERRTSIQQNLIFQKPQYQLNIYLINNQIVGFIAYWIDPEFAFIEHFAISSEFRGKRLGSTVLQQFIEDFKIPVILEIEMPVDELTRRRLNFYELAGFSRNPHQHYMPPYLQSNPPLEMEILTFPTQISEDLFQRFSRFQKEVVMGYLISS